MSASFSPRRMIALFRKETLQVIRDPSAILIAVFLPVLLIFLFGYGVSLDTNTVRIGLVQHDSGASSQSLAAAYDNSPYFEVETGHSVAQLQKELVGGRIRGIVVIGPQFGSNLNAAARTGQVQVITDGSNPSTANFVAAYAQGVHREWQIAQGVESGGAPRAAISAEPRYWYNSALASRNFLIPGSMATILTMIGSLLTALVVAREWERGTMEALIATPVSMGEFIVTKLTPYFILGLIASTICTAMAVYIFGVPLRGSLLALYALFAAFLLPALGQGLFISAATKNQFVASQIALLTAFLPAFLLSGFIFEIGSMPTWIQALTYAVPARYLVPSLQTVFLAGDIWALLLPNIAIMMGFGALFMILTFRVTRKRLD